MLYLACYDIQNDRLRQRVADQLLKTGLERVQYSVFVGPLTSLQKNKLEQTIVNWFVGHNDCDFMLLPIDKYSTTNAIHLGNKPPDWEYLAGEKLVLIV
ncbi:CRISPR-associated endonuclease Cas2 [Runella zeae]|uniref:CRISPR-associated endonuclease Cas2 n=1 Tax=Runella zeae TaxID=94255 RepID=UPI0004156445|nr:CRISPR-associated endonuclease Cas2 [Runella zeae]